MTANSPSDSDHIPFGDTEFHYNDIFYFKAVRNATRIFCKQHPEGFLYVRPLADVERKLKRFHWSDRFFRIGNSILVNEEHVLDIKRLRKRVKGSDSINPRFSNVLHVIMSNGKAVRIARAKRASVKTRVYEILAKRYRPLSNRTDG